MTVSIPLNKYVADTVALILYLERWKMGATAKTIFASADAGSSTIHVPTIALAEILYLSEKRRITISLQEVMAYLRHHSNIKEYPLTLGSLYSASKIIDIPELHDRLIAATAHHLNLDLITPDAVIRASKFVRTVW